MTPPTATLKGNVVLITGAARRVGRAIALELARAGCDVAIHFHRSAAEAAELGKAIASLGRRAALLPADLQDESSWSQVVEAAANELGRLDILVNNASIFPTDRADDLASFLPQAWDEMLRINTIAPVGLCHHAASHLKAGGRGRIVNLCDAAADRPWSRHLAYCVSKAGLVCVTKSLAKALAPDVLVNGIAPGIAVFPESYDDELKARLTAKVPLKRAGTPEDIAHVCRYLVESEYVTGQIITVDGGRSLA